MKWKHFPRYWPFVRGIHRSPVNSPHKGQWRGALLFSLICVWINGWVNNGEAGDLRSYRVHYDVTVMNNAVCKTCNNMKDPCETRLKMKFVVWLYIYTVETNALEKRVAVLIWKTIFSLISFFSKLVTYIMMPVAMSFRRNVCGTQAIHIILVYQYNFCCCSISTRWKSVFKKVFFINIILETLILACWNVYIADKML